MPEKRSPPAGSIGTATLPEVVRNLWRARASGVLILERGEETKRIVFQKGDIVFAATNVEKERLGERLVREGKIKRSVLELALRVMERSSERLGTTSDRVVLGGRSMGGRMASMAAAGATGETKKGSEPFTDPLPVAGLVLISYPLHPPGKPDRLRIEHLDRLRVPVLLISGDRDTFGTPEELADAMAAVPGPVTTVTVAGKGHDLKGSDELILSAVRDWLAGRAPRG